MCICILKFFFIPIGYVHNFYMIIIINKTVISNIFYLLKTLKTKKNFFFMKKIRE